MKTLIQTPKPIAPARDSLKRSSWRRGFLFIPLALSLTCFALAPTARAVCQNGCDFDNTFLGESALVENQGGYGDTAVGYFALSNNDVGWENTALGHFALLANTSGNYNTASGAYALSQNTTGSFNIASGYSALSENTTGSFNTAIGGFALNYNTTGSSNTASGYYALIGNTTGFYNVATGRSALLWNTAGYYNTASGVNALYYNTTGSYNSADGTWALYHNTTGNNNTAEGEAALLGNTSGNNNTALGYHACYANTTGSSNIALGNGAGLSLTTGSYNIDIGNAGVAGEANTIRLGNAGTQTNTYIAGIYGVTASRGVGVFIDSNGHLGTTTSSARFKDEIKPMENASEAILALQPVTFRYKAELDPEGIPQFGLIAEQVEKVNPDLVARDEQGKPYTVRYEAVNAMLLNEFLKEHRKMEEQEAAIIALRLLVAQQRKDFQSMASEQQKEINALTVGLREQASQIQRATRPKRVGVSKFATGRIRRGTPISQMVADSQ
jgi:hypothetical protein